MNYNVGLELALIPSLIAALITLLLLLKSEWGKLG
jgi:hypothetical protein